MPHQSSYDMLGVDHCQIRSDHRKPLGNPAQNGIKFFCTADILELLKDRSWLTKMTNTINQHWHKKNSGKKCHSSNGAQNGHSRTPELAEVDGRR
jgi:hypothetical protein